MMIGDESLRLHKLKQIVTLFDNDMFLVLINLLKDELANFDANYEQKNKGLLHCNVSNFFEVKIEQVKALGGFEALNLVLDRYFNLDAVLDSIAKLERERQRGNNARA